MNAYVDAGGTDPRRQLSADELDLASICAAPQVGKAARGADTGLILGAVAALSLGAITLFMMSAKATTPATSAAPAAAVAKPVVMAAAEPPALSPAPSTSAPLPANAVDPNQSRANPMIVDNTDGNLLSAANRSGGGAAGAPLVQPGQPSQILTADEQFSSRIGGGDAGTAYAQGLSDPTSTVMQGTIIPAVLETALNSDLPGYARAMVSREVRGFDGRRIVIPRGSRLIGQYKSGLATGQSRAFIVWTRLIRPDGVSIALGSPVMDETGQVGLGGKVNRHFLQRFGGAMLLSVVAAVPTALSGGSSYVISTSSDAQSAAAQALQADAKIAPTIRVPLGTPIQVFTARDLDFGAR